MANYKTHVAWAGLLGVGVAALGWQTMPEVVGWDALCLAAMAGWIGGTIPDLDHDTGTGLAEVSALLSSLLPVVYVASLAHEGGFWRSWGLLALLPAHYGLHASLRRVGLLRERHGLGAAVRAVCVSALCCGVFVGALVMGGGSPPGVRGAGQLWLWMVAGGAGVQLLLPVFKRFTVHRGVFHTVPAVMVYGLGAFLFFGAMAWEERLLIGAAAFLGGMSHLVLDEIYAVDFDGLGFKARRSFGTALSFWKERYPVASASVYVLLLAMAAVAVGLEPGVVEGWLSGL